MKQIFEQVTQEICSKYWNSDIKEEYPEIVAGDTDSFFIELSTLVNPSLSEDENLEKLEKISIEILDTVINKALIREYLPELLNWNTNHIYLDLEYEALGRTYNLDAKKKYVYYIQKPKEKLDIKGMETERSDYPAESRQLLLQIIEMLVVQKKHVDEIIKLIQTKQLEFEERLRKWDTSLGRPVSYAKDISSYKKVPAHVIGMEVWNILANSHDFKPGSKGYAFRVQTKLGKLPADLQIKIRDKLDELGSKQSNLEWLVIPELGDVSIIPDGIYVDVEYMINFVLKDRVRILLEPLGIDPFQNVKTRTLWDDIL